jgi:hypothetical protein
MREGTTLTRLTAANGPYGEFYDFYSISPENFGYHLVLTLGPRPTAKNRLPFFNRTQSRVVTGLFTGHNTLKRHLSILELMDSPSCRRCGAEKETSDHVL